MTAPDEKLSVRLLKFGNHATNTDAEFFARIAEVAELESNVNDLSEALENLLDYHQNIPETWSAHDKARAALAKSRGNK